MSTYILLKEARIVKNQEKDSKTYPLQSAPYIHGKQVHSLKSTLVSFKYCSFSLQSLGIFQGGFSQAVLLLLGTKPKGQLRQLVARGSSTKVLLEQARHFIEASFAAYVPAAQVKQNGAPDLVAKYPGVHSKHSTSSLPRYNPGAHSVQEIPARPAAHAEQAVLPISPLVELGAIHFKQDVFAERSWYSFSGQN